jgi:hypothetical protein
MREIYKMAAINSDDEPATENVSLKWPHLACFVAKRNSGKSHLMKYLLYNEARRQSFKTVFVISPTSFNGEWDILVGKKNVSNIYSPTWLENLLTAQSKLVKKKKPNEMLLILDDCVGSAKFNDEVMTKIAIAGRHYKLTCWISSQGYTKIPPLIRTNCDYMFIMNKIPRPVIERCLEEFPPDRDDISNWRSLSDYAAKVTRDYGVLLIDNSGGCTKHMRIRAPASIPVFKIS